MHKSLLAIMLGLGAVALGAQPVSARARSVDPEAGTWVLDVKHSRFGSGSVPAGRIARFESVGDGVKATITDLRTDGSRSVIAYTARYDGGDYPLTGSPLANAVSLRRQHGRLALRTDKKDGKVIAIHKHVLAKHGKTRAVTVDGVNEKGAVYRDVLLFVRHSEPPRRRD